MSARKVALLLRLSQELKEKVANVAKREHRSLNQQIEFILERFLAQATTNVEEERENEGKRRAGKH